MAFMGKLFYFYIFFLKVQLYLCICLCLYVSIYIFYILQFQVLKMFQGSSLNFINQIVRTLEWAANKLLNGSRVNSHRQFILESKAWFV